MQIIFSSERKVPDNRDFSHLGNLMYVFANGCGCSFCFGFFKNKHGSPIRKNKKLHCFRNFFMEISPFSFNMGEILSPEYIPANL